MAEIGMPRIPASTRAARYGLDRITATGSIDCTAGVGTASRCGLIGPSLSAIPTFLADGGLEALTCNHLRPPAERWMGCRLRGWEWGVRQGSQSGRDAPARSQRLASRFTELAAGKPGRRGVN